MFHRLSGVAGIAALLAGHAAAQEAPSLPGDIQVFEPSFFARYNPTTAQDMVNQVPGFSIQEGDAVRGFGGSAGNILINGNRPSTKNSLTALLGRIGVDGPVQSFPLTAMVADRFAAPNGRVALVGEAAHVVPPIGAQGFNLALRDVETLSDLIAAAGDPGSPALLAAYDGRRRADTAIRSAAIDAFNRSLLSDFLPVQGLRGLGMFLLGSIAPLRRLVMRHVLRS